MGPQQLTANHIGMTSWISLLVVSSPLALCDKGFGRGPPGGLGQYSSGAGSGGSFGAASDFGGAGVDAGALEDTIPGIPGEDYPIYASVPETSFFCDGQVDGGYYGDPEAECQAFHICANDGTGGLTKYSFLCPNGTLFQQQYFVCDWWFNVDCSTAEDFYSLNEEIAAERAANSPEGAGGYQGGAGQAGGARRGGGGSSGRRGGSSGSATGSRAAASSPRGSYSAPEGFGSAPSYTSPSDFGSADAGYGAPGGSDGGFGSAGAGYGAPAGYSRRNARGLPLDLLTEIEEEVEMAKMEDEY